LHLIGLVQLIGTWTCVPVQHDGPAKDSMFSC
jgi:hypothetical protein